MALQNKSAREKIKTIDELAAIARKVRKNGEVLVHAHGTFDLLHMGHVRHLERARQEGTALMVTITADKNVNKGPGRPVFTAALRAEMVAALGYVDWVAVNDSPSAEGIIEKLSPDVYVKGSDYADASADATGKISVEQLAVEACGGRIVFTDDITFSSSSLLNRHFGIHDSELMAYLDKHRHNGTLDKLLALLEKVKNYKVLVVGDTIIDEYQYVAPMGKSPKENLIATLYHDRELFAGGVIAAANHAAGFCKEVDILTSLGEVDSHEEFVRSHLKENVSLDAQMIPNVPTTRKCRFVDRDYMRKMFEVYFMDDTPLHGKAEEAFAASIKKRAGDYDLVIVTDFGHGLITSRVIEALTQHAKFLAVNAQSNSANHGFNLITKYKKANYVCIDAPEARLAISNQYGDLGKMAGEYLPKQIDCDRMIITHGKHGCVTYDKRCGTGSIPAFTDMVLDTIGAGDAFLAVTSPLVATGEDMELIGFVGNAVGALKVGIIGHRQSVEKLPLVRYLQTILK